MRKNFADAVAKPFFRKRKACHGFERSHYDTLFKRRKFPNQYSALTLDGGFSSESVSNSLVKGMGGNNPSSSSKQHESKDSHGTWLLVFSHHLNSCSSHSVVFICRPYLVNSEI